MEGFRVGLVLIIPWLAGTLWVRALWRDAQPGVWPLALGYGYLLGGLATVLLLRAQAVAGLPMDFAGPLIVLGLLALAGSGLAWRRILSAHPDLPPQKAQAPDETWQTLLFILLLGWLGWRCFGLAQEIEWRPLYPWDAWTTWMVRAKVWSELQQWVPFVDPQTWLTSAHGSAYTLAAWNYPETVSLLALWPTLAFGAWNETVALLPWLGIAVALGCGFYGQARLWGVSPLVALIFVWLLLSLPILDTHVALAGYADLWLAATFGLAACAFLQWARTRDPWQGILALLLALACPWIKHEGLVWALLLLPAAVWVWTPRRYWPWLIGGFILLLVGWWAAGGFTFNIAGLGKIRLTPDTIRLPLVGRFELHYHDVWGPVIRNLLLLGNWHLFGYLLLATLLMSLPGIFAEPWRMAGAMLVIAGLLVLFILFFLTDAHHWARQYTSINRVFLHFVPALLFWIMTMLHIKVPTTPTESL
ncbi:MAG: hypothetical protein KDJ28_01790 [Candidatus Competibacteraceae bacterium]|nr:hypothetical protein [Candidatus Competibacteraceae bacterium]